jgi:hypothetical protein
MNLRIIAKIAIILSISQVNAEYEMETFSLNYQGSPQYNLNTEYKPETTMNFSDNEIKYKRDSISIEEKTQMKAARKAEMNQGSRKAEMNQGSRKEEMEARKAKMKSMTKSQRRSYMKKNRSKMKNRR